MYRRTSNRAASGQYAHLIGHRVTWEETFDMQTWHACTGKIKRVDARAGNAFFIDDHSGLLGMGVTQHWLIPGQSIRNVQVH